MAIIKGGDMMLFVGGNVNGYGKSIGFATSHTLNISADTKESSTKDDGGKWQKNESGILSWSVTTENLMSNDQEGVGYKDLVQYMMNRTPIIAFFDLEGNSTQGNKLDNVPTGGWSPLYVTAGSTHSKGYRGTVIITSVEFNAPNGENATFTANFTGTGALTPLYPRAMQQANNDNTTTLDENDIQLGEETSNVTTP